MKKSPIQDLNEDASSSSSEDNGSRSSGSSSNGGSSSENSSSSASGVERPSTSVKVENASANGSGAGSSFAQPADTEENDLDVKLDELVDQVERFCKNKYKNRLCAEFKTELPPIDVHFLGGLERFLRMPHFMPVEPEAYEAHTFQNALRPEDLNDKESRDAFITKLKTTVRWRECQDKSTGELYKESNARIVRWSDGSETFHVGAEAFDVVKHPMPMGQNQLYVRQGSYYYRQGPIKDKMTLRPKLESNFGQSHVQGLRKRAFYKPLNSCVKVLMDLSTNPVLDRERKVKEEQAQERKEKSDKRREQKNQRKPRVKPMRHCTADDIDAELPIHQSELETDRYPLTDDQDHQNANTATVFPEVKRTPGIRTNRNTEMKPMKYEEESDDYEGENDNFSPYSKADAVEQPKHKPDLNAKSNSKQTKLKHRRKQAILSDSE